MADIRPFKAFRPTKELAGTIAALPYDVYSRQEAAAYVKQHPDSFLAIDRAETQFPDDFDMYDEKVYEKAREMLDERIEKGDFVQDSAPCYYLYEQTWNGRSQTGIAACAAIDDYVSGVIKKHENTVEAKEQDRIRHVDTCGAQTGPVFLAYRSDASISAVTKEVKEGAPVYDFVSDGNVRNRVWVIEDKEKIGVLSEAFRGIGSIYIADGHHRCASAVKTGLKRRAGDPSPSADKEYNYFLCVLFPEDELEIMDYNRVVKDVSGLDKSEILTAVKKYFRTIPYRKNQAKPTVKGEFGMYMAGSWYMLTVNNSMKSGDPVKGLDVSILQNTLLGPVFHIEDPRTDPKIEFVGGIRGLDELEKRADQYNGVAFAMYPTSIRELFAVADAGMLMPPKSTWFEPKLLSGLFIHRFE